MRNVYYKEWKFLVNMLMNDKNFCLKGKKVKFVIIFLILI